LIRVLIADDHPIVRRGLKQILAEEADIAVGAEAQNAQEVLQLLRTEKFDTLVLDLNMPGRSGLELLKDVRERWPSLPVLVMSVQPEEQFAVRVLKAGAAGYVSKETAPEVLVVAIRQVHRGGKYISPATAERLARVLGNDLERQAHEALTDREYQILCLIGSGKSVSAIADQLSLSVKTVSTYRTRILEKMRLTNNAELMQYALRNDLVQ
jgi:DNA-binding NarL/FixJ family response regulator